MFRCNFPTKPQPHSTRLSLRLRLLLLSLSAPTLSWPNTGHPLFQGRPRKPHALPPTGMRTRPSARPLLDWLLLRSTCSCTSTVHPPTAFAHRQATRATLAAQGWLRAPPWLVWEDLLYRAEEAPNQTASLALKFWRSGLARSWGGRLSVIGPGIQR